MARFIDLSHALANGLPNFPGDPLLRIKAHHTIPPAPCNVSELVMSSHQGTHLDAPFHFVAEGKTVDQIPLTRFFGPAVLVDLAPGTALAPRTPLTVESFAPHTALFTPGARVIYRTGWDRQFGQERFFTEFPTLTLEAAQWMADRRIGLIGMDTPTPSVDFEKCHHILLGTGVEMVIVEGLARLEQLPPRFTFIGFPLKINRGDGSPIRAVAMVDE